MNKYNKVVEIVESVYKRSDREMAKWMWVNQVSVVAKFSQQLVDKYGGDPDIAVAGAWLHDIADAFMDRSDVHEEKSLQKAREILKEAGYNNDDIDTIIKEVLVPHSCYPDNLPHLLDGKILASADALAHITTDFYTQFCWMHIPQGKTYKEYREWVSEKIERDYHVKIFFEEEKKKVQSKYKALKLVLSD